MIMLPLNILPLYGWAPERSKSGDGETHTQRLSSPLNDVNAAPPGELEDAPRRIHSILNPQRLGKPTRAAPDLQPRTRETFNEAADSLHLSTEQNLPLGRIKPTIVPSRLTVQEADHLRRSCGRGHRWHPVHHRGEVLFLTPTGRSDIPKCAPRLQNLVDGLASGWVHIVHSRPIV